MISADMLRPFFFCRCKPALASARHAEGGICGVAGKSGLHDDRWWADLSLPRAIQAGVGCHQRRARLGAGGASSAACMAAERAFTLSSREARMSRASQAAEIERMTESALVAPELDTG